LRNSDRPIAIVHYSDGTTHHLWLPKRVATYYNNEGQLYPKEMKIVVEDWHKKIKPAQRILLDRLMIDPDVGPASK
jgi:hypothetical protein